MKWLVCILSLTLVALGQAQAMTLQEYVEKKIIVLDRPLLTFHYRHSTEPNNMNDVIKMAEEPTTWFYNPRVGVDKNIVGPGLYVAIDPASSHNYGLPKPQLYTVMLKKGTRILDVRGMPREDSDKEFDHITDKLRCFTSAYGFSALQDLRESPSALCREEVIRAYKALNVEAIVYDFPGSGTIDNCRAPHDVAFDVISASAIDRNNLNYYSDTRKFESSPQLTPFIADFFMEARRDQNLDQDMTNLLLPASIKMNYSSPSSNYEQLKSDLIWKCGPVRPSEKSQGVYQ